MRMCCTRLILLFLSSAAPLLAAQPAAQEEAPQLTVDALGALRQAAEANTELSETDRAQAAALYTEAEGNLKAQKEFVEQTRQYAENRTTAPKQSEDLQKRLAEALPEVKQDELSTLELSELERMSATAEAELAATQQQLATLNQEPDRRAERRKTASESMANARAQLTEARDLLNASSPDNPAIATAQQAAARARVQRLSAEISSYEEELLSYDAQKDLLTLQQDFARRMASYYEGRAKLLRDLVAAKRQQEAEGAATAAKQAAWDATLEKAPAVRDRLQDLAAVNQSLAEDRTSQDGILQRLELVRRGLDALTPRLAELRAQFEGVQSRVRAGGLNESTGLLLRRYRAELPDPRKFERYAKENLELVADAELATIDLREQRESVASDDVVVQEVLSHMPQEEAVDRERVAADVRKHLQTQRKLLGDMVGDYQEYAQRLTELVSKQKELATLSEEFRDFINANILWSGGARAFHWGDLRQAQDALRWLLLVDNWESTWTAVAVDSGNVPVFYALGILLFLVLIYLKFRTHKKLREVGEQARKKWHIRYVETPLALLYTVLQVLPFAFLLGFLGWRLGYAAQDNPFTGSIAAGLRAVAFVWFVLEMLRQLFMPNGLVEAHFEWTAARVRGVRHFFGVMAVFALPIVFLVFCYEFQSNEDWKSSLGRVAFIVLMAGVVFFSYPLIRAIFNKMREQPGSSWLAEHRGARAGVFLLCIGGPVVLGGVALTGFYYTALRLGMHLFYTFAFVMVVMLTFSVLRRWFVITRRRLAIEQARRRREAAKAEENAPSEQELIDQELDLVRLDTQTQKLLRTFAAMAILVGMYFIWQEILPALKVLDQFEVYSSASTVLPVAVPAGGGDAGGEASVPAAAAIQLITLADVTLAGIILAFTLAAVKNLPSLIEIVLLSRMHLGSGERYATLAIFRYILVALGAFLAFRAIGIGWANVQWLVAAVGLGLGFGLQEIFANFVSGLILLFERPVRVGDIVTIGDRSGVVSKIRMRATSVTDFDKKELVIPNKDLITGQLTNWTLADNMIRLKLGVGVAYGTDAKLVFETLQEIVTSHPDVLKEPKPAVVFNAFGASSLDFDIYVYVRLENGFKVRTELNTQIHEQFNELGFEIPFPQTDLHLRSGMEVLRAVAEKQGETTQPEL